MALLECGVFLEDTSICSEESFGSPKADVSPLPMMNLAHQDAPDEKKRLEDDVFDEHAWLVDTVHKHRDKDLSRIDESLPRLPNRRESKTCASIGVGGKLVVQLDKKDRQKTVNVAAVMNRGAYCVIETCPLTKAYEIVTSLGLQHLVVLGGESGGNVVGIVTRSNLLPHFVKERTKLFSTHP